MNVEAFNVIRASDHAAPLRGLLACHLGVSPQTYEREASGAATPQDLASLTALRFLFGDSTTAQATGTPPTKALVWLRRQKAGRLIEADLNSIINETRYVYESTTANEATRLLLLAYKQVKDILYDKELGDAVCLPKD